MLKAILYKEWLKVRWTYLILLLIILMVSLYNHLALVQAIKFNLEKIYWYYVIFKQLIFYSLLKYVPLLSGIALSLSQFIPEVVSSRLKLTFHLPLNENKVLIQKLLFGYFLLLCLSTLLLGLLSISTLAYFPIEVLASVLTTSLPIVLSGFAGYTLLSIVIIEPSWIKRVLLVFITYAFVETFLEGFDYSYNLYERSFEYFSILSILIIITILYPGYRFKRGAR